MATEASFGLHLVYSLSLLSRCQSSFLLFLENFTWSDSCSYLRFNYTNNYANPKGSVYYPIMKNKKLLSSHWQTPNWDRDGILCLILCYTALIYLGKHRITLCEVSSDAVSRCGIFCYSKHEHQIGTYLVSTSPSLQYLWTILVRLPNTARATGFTCEVDITLLDLRLWNPWWHADFEWCFRVLDHGTSKVLLLRSCVHSLRWSHSQSCRHFSLSGCKQL